MMIKWAFGAAITALSIFAVNAPAHATDLGTEGCFRCSTSKHYDRTKVVKSERTVHHHQVIETASYRGRPARIRSDVTLVNFVTHHYRVIEASELTPASEAGPAAPSRPSCEHRRANRYDCPVRSRG
jgi:hypothetical protein